MLRRCVRSNADAIDREGLNLVRGDVHKVFRKGSVDGPPFDRMNGGGFYRRRRGRVDLGGKRGSCRGLLSKVKRGNIGKNIP